MVGAEVGSGACVGVGVPRVEQDANKTMSRKRLSMSRCILSKGKVETIGKLSHCFSQKRIQIYIFIFEHLFCYP
jgi:hypothetical protein